MSAGVAPVDPPLDAAEWRCRRAAIIGAGAMGSALAASLGTVMPVVMVCRSPERAMQLFRDGARVTGIVDIVSRPIIVSSVSEIPKVGGVDAVFVATKTTSISDVAAELRPVLPALRTELASAEAQNAAFPLAAPAIVSFQNGIEPGQELMRRLQHGFLLRAVLNFAACLDPRTGTVTIRGSNPPHYVGNPEAAYEPVGREIVRALNLGGIEAVYTRDIERVVWEKAILNAASNPVAALVNGTIADVLDSPSRTILEQLVDEAVAVAEADGITLSPGYRGRVTALMHNVREHVPSMVEDIRGGRESEVGQLNAQIIRRGRQLGVPTPTHETIVALIGTFDWRIYQSRGASAPTPR